MAIRPFHKVFYHTEKQITIQGYWKVEIYDILVLVRGRLGREL